MRNLILLISGLILSFPLAAKPLGELFENTNLPVPTTKNQGVSRFEVYNNELFVSTTDGIYKYMVDTKMWEPWAMKGVWVLDFVLNGDKIIAIGNPDYVDLGASFQSARLIRGKIGSSEIEDITLSSMEYTLDEMTMTYLMNIAQKPSEPSTVICSSHGGIVRTDNFGETWYNICDFYYEYNPNQFLGWHPYLSDIIFYSSEDMILSPTMLRSENDGRDWDFTDMYIDRDNSAHHIAFDSGDYNHMLLSGEGVIWESKDCGKSWEIVYNEYDPGNEDLNYAYSIMFDTFNQNYAYCVGCLNGNEQKIVIFKSVDKGKSWYKITESGSFLNHDYWVSEAILFNNKIFINTYGGIFTYDLTSESGIEYLNNFETSEEKPLYYNLRGDKLSNIPSNTIYIEKCGKNVKKRIK